MEEIFLDPTGIILTPSYHGEKCVGNGENDECCCDECDFYLECFPDWKTWENDIPFKVSSLE